MEKEISIINDYHTKKNILHDLIEKKKYIENLSSKQKHELSNQNYNSVNLEMIPCSSWICKGIISFDFVINLLNDSIETLKYDIKFETNNK